jgi:uncharacterized protein DUF4199
MKRIVLTFGLISGAVLAAMLIITMPFADKIGFGTGGMILGFTTMILAFLLVFFGIRSYRETVGNGEISFFKALGVGLLIMVVANLCYVVTWEIIYFNFLPEFGPKYTAHAIETVRASGKSPEEIAREIEKVKWMMNLYNNSVLFSAAVSFIEPTPVGIPMTLISALLLRKRRKQEEDLQELPDGVKGTPVNP